MKNLFKPEDFKFTLNQKYVFQSMADAISKVANKIMQKKIESWPVVYGNLGYDFGVNPSGGDTHTARLAFIEEIKCSHKNSSIWEPHLAGARKCNDCGYEYNPNISKEWYPEPCKHEPISRMMVEDMNYRNEFGLIGITILDPSSSNCAKCGSKIMARWEEKK